MGALGEGSAPAGIRTQVTGVRGLNDYQTTLQERLVIVFMHENILNSLWLICYVVIVSAVTTLTNITKRQ